MDEAPHMSATSRARALRAQRQPGGSPQRAVTFAQPLVATGRPSDILQADGTPNYDVGEMSTYSNPGNPLSESDSILSGATGYLIFASVPAAAMAGFLFMKKPSIVLKDDGTMDWMRFLIAVIGAAVVGLFIKVFFFK